jgi:hypothetical protein
VDKITNLDDENEVVESEIADSERKQRQFKTLGFLKFDSAIYIFYQEYRKDPEIKQFLLQNKKKNGIWYYK